MGSTLTVPHQGQVSVNRRCSAVLVLVPMTTGILLSMEGLAFLRPSDLPAPVRFHPRLPRAVRFMHRTGMNCTDRWHVRGPGECLSVLMGISCPVTLVPLGAIHPPMPRRLSSQDQRPGARLRRAAPAVSGLGPVLCLS